MDIIMVAVVILLAVNVAWGIALLHVNRIAGIVLLFCCLSSFNRLHNMAVANCLIGQCLVWGLSMIIYLVLTGKARFVPPSHQPEI